MESKLPKHDKPAEKDQSGGEEENTSRRKPPPSESINNYSAEVSHIISEDNDLQTLKRRLMELNESLLYRRSEGSKKKKRKRRPGAGDGICGIWFNKRYARLERERAEIIDKIKEINHAFIDAWTRPTLHRVYIPFEEGIDGVKEQNDPLEKDVVYAIVEANTEKSLQKACYAAKKYVGVLLRQGPGLESNPPAGSSHPPPPPMHSKELEAKDGAIEASLSQLSLYSRPHQQGFAKHRKTTSF